jgi:putative tryptophan/tyrosine transport system substrate-binding protein
LCADSIVNSNHARINTLALQAGTLTLSPGRDYLDGGGLLSYGPKNTELFRRAADFVDKILHGAKPADLPVEQPTEFELVINQKVAATLGLKIPPNMLALADEVIE